MVNVCFAYAQRAYTLSNENRDLFFLKMWNYSKQFFFSLMKKHAPPC